MTQQENYLIRARAALRMTVMAMLAGALALLAVAGWLVFDGRPGHFAVGMALAVIAAALARKAALYVLRDRRVLECLQDQVDRLDGGQL